MYCPHFTIVVCAIGVLLATVGASKYDEFIETELSMEAYSDSGLQKRSAGEDFKETKSSFKQTFMTGIAEIHYYPQGMICTGILLRNWIVLTSAECVRRLDPYNTYVRVNVGKDDHTYNVKVGVNNILIDPSYAKGNPLHDIALLIIYGDRKWHVTNFLLPDQEYTTDIIIESGIQTYLYQWGDDFSDFTPYYQRVPVTDDFALCGSSYIFANRWWYCVDLMDVNYNYDEMDIGSPIYFWSNGDQKVLGIYTGYRRRERTSGVLYASIYPSIRWIRRQLHDNPGPPLQ